jgi:hypothetical protein
MSTRMRPTATPGLLLLLLLLLPLRSHMCARGDGQWPSAAGAGHTDQRDLLYMRHALAEARAALALGMRVVQQ